MGKLTNIKPTVSMLAPVLGRVPGDKIGTDRDRNAAAPWRAWYGTERWRRLRLAVFVRDNFVCQRTGVLCIGRYPAPTSAVANHKRPHRGNPELFWDINNIETVTKEVHDGLIQQEEQAIPTGQWD